MANRLLMTSALMAVIVGASSPSWAVPIVEQGSGANPAVIQGTVDAFRADLGNPLNPNVAGSFPSGRREINWDGVPNNFAAPNNLPPDFFNVNSPRGTVFSTPGTAVQVSANAGVAPVRFDNINPTYSSMFQTFSPQRLFTAVGSNIVDVNFFVPGSTTPATVSGFGSVFTDVDQANTTSIQYFNANGTSLGTFFAPTANNGLSFLGVSRFDEGIARVRITTGNSALGPSELAGTPIDVVVMDDFLYGEPQAIVPEPSSLLLLVTGLSGLAWIRKKTGSLRV
ncbi:PEP-CTERM sorting domain-containing protein [Nitrospira sp. Nam74]